MWTNVLPRDRTRESGGPMGHDLTAHAARLTPVRGQAAAVVAHPQHEPSGRAPQREFKPRGLVMGDPLVWPTRPNSSRISSGRAGGSNTWLERPTIALAV